MWHILLVIMLCAGTVGMFLYMVVQISELIGKIEETHETVLWIKDKLDHDP